MLSLFLSIQLLNELSYPFHLTYSLFPFFLITFSILNFFDLFFAILFHKEKVPIISAPLRSLITYVHGTVFLSPLIAKISSDQFGV